jgi:hypothetical protein
MKTKTLLPLALAAFVLGDVRAAAPPSGTLAATGPAATWQGFAAVASSPAGETSCVEGTNCDTFSLKLAPGDYTGKRIRFKISWTNQFNDYDLDVFAGSVSGPLVGTSGGGIPEIKEETTVDVNRVVAAGENVTFAVRAVYFAVVTSDPYQGIASVEAIPVTPGRNPSYVPGSKVGIAFSRNRPLLAFAAQGDTEPSVRVDFQGNAYAGGIRGAGGGDDLWRFDLNPGSPTYDPFLRGATATIDINGFSSNPSYKGMPDSISNSRNPQAGGDGGGDMDMAVGFGLPTTLGGGSFPALALSSLVVANISTQRSFDRAESYTRNPIGNAPNGVNDRNWMEFDGSDAVYLAYRDFTGLQITSKFWINRSGNAGLSYGAPVLAAVGGNTTGDVTVDQRDGTVYFCYQGPSPNGNELRLAIGRPTVRAVGPTAADFTTVTAATGNTSTIAALFPVCKVAPDGTVYVAFSDGGVAIYLAHSTDHGRTWAQPVRVSNLANPSVSILPWLTTGKKPGAVALAWYGTEASDTDDGKGLNNDAANWRVFFAESLDATAANPTFYQSVASDHYVHGSNISLGGFGGSANRNLGDFFQLETDPQGLAFISYDDDHNDYSGNPYVTHQIGGLSLHTGAAVQISGTDRVPAPDPSLPQVLDERHDQALTLVGVTPTDNAVDILSVQYGCDVTTPVTMITATMRTSGLTTVPPQSSWRMSFATNPTRPFVSDHADQWFLRASTDATGVQTFTYGTATRASGGAMTYTAAGPADFGAFDLGNKSVTVKVALAKLNALQTHGLIVPGTTFIGLRGVAGTVGNVTFSDETRLNGTYTFDTGACAGATGGGGDSGEGDDGDTADRDHVSFSDDPSQPQNANVEYSAPRNNFTMHSVGGSQAVTYTNGACVNLLGAATVNLAPGYTYAFTACNLPTATQIGTFTMSITGPLGFVYQKSAPLVSGRLSIRPR